MVRSCAPLRNRSPINGLPAHTVLFPLRDDQTVVHHREGGRNQKGEPVPNVAPDQRVPARVELGPLGLLAVVAGLLDVTLPDDNPDGPGAGASVVSRNRDGARRVASVTRVAWAPEGRDRIALEPVKSDDRGATDARTGAIVGATGI